MVSLDSLPEMDPGQRGPSPLKNRVAIGIIPDPTDPTVGGVRS